MNALLMCVLVMFFLRFKRLICVQILFVANVYYSTSETLFLAQKLICYTFRIYLLLRCLDEVSALCSRVLYWFEKFALMFRNFRNVEFMIPGLCSNMWSKFKNS